MESKKAQNLSITTIILIILGVVVLVVLIIGFTKGWGSVKEFFTGGGSGLSQIASQCSIACSTGDEISWCQKRSVTVNGVEESKTCTDFATSYTSIEECPAVSAKCPKTDTQAPKCEGYQYDLTDPNKVKVATICNKDTEKCVGRGISHPESKLWVEATTSLCCDSLGCVARN